MNEWLNEWIVFVVWLTDERRLALSPAGTIVRDPHHRESLSSRYALSRVWTCAEPEFRVSWIKLCSSDNHYTTTPQKFYSVNYRIIINLNGFWEFWRKISPVLDLPIHPIYAYPPIYIYNLDVSSHYQLFSSNPF